MWGNRCFAGTTQSQKGFIGMTKIAIVLPKHGKVHVKHVYIYTNIKIHTNIFNSIAKKIIKTYMNIFYFIIIIN